MQSNLTYSQIYFYHNKVLSDPHKSSGNKDNIDSIFGEITTKFYISLEMKDRCLFKPQRKNP